MSLRNWCLALQAATLAAWATHGPNVGAHPGYTISTLHASSWEPKVAGLELLPSGDLLVLTWRGTTEPRGMDGSRPIVQNYTGTTALYLVKNVKGTGPGQQTEIATGFKDAHGVIQVNGEIYVGDVDRIVKLTDSDKDGKYEGKQEICKIPSYKGWFEYSFGPVHKDGKLYMALAAGVAYNGTPTKQGGKDRSAVVSCPIGGGTYSVVAEGFRAPDGIGIGLEDEIYTTDNQGGWRPASMFINVRPGRFYGYKVDPQGAIQSGGAPVTQPAIWTPHKEANDSPTEPTLMKVGPYAGQFIYGDIGRGGIYRAFLEKVKGEWQGGIIPFSGGLEVGVQRLRAGPDGEIYVGGLGMGSHSNQGWNNTKFGLQKLTPKGNTVFEILAVRSRAKGIEIEFTQPVAADAGQASKFSIRQWRYSPTVNYGGPKVDDQPRTVAGVQVSPDRKSIYLEITGLKTQQVVGITTTGLKSEGGAALFFDRTWYTLNAISESNPFDKPVSTASAPLPQKLQLHRTSAGLTLDLPEGRYRVEILRPDGRLIKAFQNAASGLNLPAANLPAGLHLLRVTNASGSSIAQPILF